MFYLLTTDYCLLPSLHPFRGGLLVVGGAGGGLPEFDGGVVAGGEQEQSAGRELDLVYLLGVRADAREHAARARVVEADAPAAARLGQHAPVGRELQLVDHLGLPQLAQLAPRARVPEDEPPVARAAREPQAVGREGDRSHPVVVPGERVQRLARRNVPQPDRVVALGAGARQTPPVGREGERRHRVVVPFELAQEPPRPHVPQAYDAVAPARGEQAAVGREDDLEDPLLVPSERAQRPERPRVEEPHLGRAAVQAVGDVAPVVRDGGVADGRARPFDGLQQTPRPHVPDPQVAVVARGDDARAAGEEGGRVDRALVPAQRPRELPARGGGGRRWRLRRGYWEHGRQLAVAAL